MQESTARVPARTIGLDLSDEASTYCTLDAEGVVCDEGSFPTNLVALQETFGEVAPNRIVLEASTQVHWIARELTNLGHEVIVANPRQLAMISKSARKIDRNDAHTLARLGRADPNLLCPIQLRDEGCLATQSLLQARKQLVDTRTRLISLVRAQFKVHGSSLAPSCSETFHKKARSAMPELLHQALLPLLEIMEELTGKIRHYDKEIEQLCQHSYPQTQVLRQVCGVGPQVALAFVTTVGDPKRFVDSRTVGAYLGLVPRSFQSGERKPHLRISKQGDRELRTLLVNAAAYILRRSSPDSSLKRFGRRLARSNTPRDRARARIAVARKLAVLLHRLLLTAEVYEPLRGAR